MAEEKFTKFDELKKYSDFNVAQQRAEEYLGNDTVLFTSPRAGKKYRIYDTNKCKWVDFGQMGYEDFTKHKDEERRQRYLARATRMHGNWRDNPFSANNL
ncbi:MAG: DUF5754 family protein, partial [Fusobacteriaceae bacterium]